MGFGRGSPLFWSVSLRVMFWIHLLIIECQMSKLEEHHLRKNSITSYFPALASSAACPSMTAVVPLT